MPIIGDLERCHALSRHHIDQNSTEVIANLHWIPAHNIFEDLVVNHWEQIERDYGDRMFAIEQAGLSGRPDMQVIARIAPNSPTGVAIATVIDLADREARQSEHPEDRRAVDLIGAFWVIHGKHFTSSLCEFDVTPTPH